MLWLSGRYNGVVYAISTRNGRLLAKIPVGRALHELCVWPQPGRYPLGHTGILRWSCDRQGSPDTITGDIARQR